MSVSASSSPSSIPEDSLIWNFVASRIRSANGRLLIFRVGESTWHEFKKAYCSAKNTAQFYANRFELHLVPNLESAPFGDHQKLDLFWALGLKITKEFLKKVEISHSVKCDSDWYVIDYANMGEHEEWDNVNWQYPQQVLESLPEKRIRKPTYKLRQEHKEHVEDVCHKKIQKMWAFLAAQIRNPVTQDLSKAIVSPDTWQRFLGAKGNDEKALELHEYYLEEMAPNLHLMKFRQEKVLHLYWALGIPVNKEYLRNLRRHYDLTTDRTGKIVVYSKKLVKIKAEQFEPSKHTIQRSESPAPLKKLKIELENSDVVNGMESQKSSLRASNYNETFEDEMDDTFDILSGGKSPFRHLDNSIDFEMPQDSLSNHLKASEAYENPKNEMAHDNGICGIQEKQDLENSSPYHLKEFTASGNPMNEMAENKWIQKQQDLKNSSPHHLKEFETSRNPIDKMAHDNGIHEIQKHQDLKKSSLHHLKASEASEDPIDEVAENNAIQKHNLKQYVASEQPLDETIDYSTTDDTISTLSDDLQNSEPFFYEMDDDYDQQKLQHSSSRRPKNNRKARRPLKNQESSDDEIDFNDTVREKPQNLQNPEDNRKNLRGRMLHSISDDMWSFLRNEIHDMETGDSKKVKLNVETWRRFKKIRGVKKASVSLEKHFNTNVAPRLHECRFHADTKLELYWSLELKVNHLFLESLDHLYNFEISPFDTLLSYTSKTYEECQQWWPKSSRVWEFILKNGRNSCCMLARGMVNLKSEEFRQMFNKKFVVEKSAVEIRERFNDVLIPLIPKEQLPLSDKLAIHHLLQIPLSDKFMNHCRKFARICVNPVTRIVERFQMNFSQEEIDKILDDDSEEVDDIQTQKDVPSTSGSQVLTWQNREIFEMKNQRHYARSKYSKLSRDPRGIAAEDLLCAVKKMPKKSEKKKRNVLEDDEYERPEIMEPIGQGNFVPYERVHDSIRNALNLFKSRVSN